MEIIATNNVKKKKKNCFDFEFFPPGKIWVVLAL